MNAQAWHLRRATERDARVLWEWANDPVVREASFNTAPIEWSEHVAWFGSRLQSPRCFIYFAETEQGLPMAQVRFDVRDNGEAEVGIIVAREYRGLRLSTPVLQGACDQFRRESDAPITARIKVENRPSQRVFEQAGFRVVGTERVGDVQALRLVFEPAAVGSKASFGRV